MKNLVPAVMMVLRSSVSAQNLVVEKCLNIHQGCKSMKLLMASCFSHELSSKFSLCLLTLHVLLFICLNVVKIYSYCCIEVLLLLMLLLFFRVIFW